MPARPRLLDEDVAHGITLEDIANRARAAGGAWLDIHAKSTIRLVLANQLLEWLDGLDVTRAVDAAALARRMDPLV